MLGQTKKLCQPIGITPRSQPANQNYTLAIPQCSAGIRWLPTSPPPSWGVNRQESRGAVLKNHLQQTDVDFLHCPWNLATLAFQAKQMRNGCVSCQLVQCDQAAIAVDLRTATCPTIRNSVWAGPVTANQDLPWGAPGGGGGGPLDWWLMGSLTNKLQETNGLSKWAKPPFYTFTTVESDSAFSKMSHCVLLVAW